MPEEHVQVVCRLRPRNQRELRNSQVVSQFVEVDKHSSRVHLNAKEERKSFTFDHSLGEEATQEELFEIVGAPITNRCLEGYNGTILCYGQTGSGKTYTLFGDSIPFQDRGLLSTNRGLVPRILEYLWSNCDVDFQYRFTCSFYEIYQEKIYDLLNTKNDFPLAVREDCILGVYVEGCTEKVVTSMNDAYDVLSLGYGSRHVGETSMNRASSRSHAIFQLTIEKSQIVNESNPGVNHTITSRFSLVDLAGSERQRDTQTSGTRLREACVINKSLTCLGKVITELSSQHQGKSKRKRHINYRDSKLTFLLRDSLGGNSKTVLIATISPSERSVQETLSTLSFAQRSMNICNTTFVNECVTGSSSALQAEVLALRAQLEILKGSKILPLRNAKCSPSCSPQRSPNPPKISFDQENKENYVFSNRQKDTGNQELLKINRELEDLLEEKENLIGHKVCEIESLKDTLERHKYELEMVREMDTGRFGHTKILMKTLEEMKRENENLSVEVQSLRYARDTLINKEEYSASCRAAMVVELEKQRDECSLLERQLSDSRRELFICQEKLNALQKEHTVTQQLYAEAKVRCENQELSLGVLKLRLKFYSESQIHPSLLRSSTDSRQLELKDVWEPLAEELNQTESEMDEITSDTEKQSDYSDTTSTIVRLSTETAWQDDSPTTEEYIPHYTIKRGRSSEEDDDGKRGFLSKVFGYISSSKKQRTELDKLATPPPPASLRCRSIEYKTNARATGYVLLSWESHISSPQSFVIERAVLTGKTKKVYSPYTLVGTTDHNQFVLSIKDQPLSMVRFRVKSVCGGQSSNWSTTATIRTPESYSPTLKSELFCDRPFNDNGVFHWIGTAGGHREYRNPHLTGDVQVTLSCKWYPVNSSLYVEREPTKLVFDPNHPCSWIQIDLGEDRLLVPTHYALRGYEKQQEILHSWEFQGKVDSSSPWVVLSSHHNDSHSMSVHEPPVGFWSVRSSYPYRYFRILQLDQECKGLACSSLELYGTLIEKDENLEERPLPVLTSF